jgi:hypothetical protein
VRGRPGQIACADICHLQTINPAKIAAQALNLDPGKVVDMACSSRESEPIDYRLAIAVSASMWATETVKTVLMSERMPLTKSGDPLKVDI